MTRVRSEAGYSLIELLVVLALLGLMAVAMSGGIRFGTRVWERTENEVAGTEMANGGHGLLRDLLGHIYPRDAASDGTEDSVEFSGDADHIEFLTRGSDGVSRVSISAKREAGFAMLLLSQQAERGLSVERNETLASGAKNIAFSYGQMVDGEMRWSDTWEKQHTLPSLVRVRMSFPPGAGRWPDLIVRPRIDKAATCIYDPVSFGCRRG